MRICVYVPIMCICAYVYMFIAHILYSNCIDAYYAYCVYYAYYVYHVYDVYYKYVFVYVYV